MTISKKTVASCAAALALAVAVAVPLKVFSQININIGDHHHEHHFDHPEVDAALGHLNSARDNLNHAAHDFGGHRVQALRAIDAAIQQCNRAIEYANHHDR